MLEKNKDYLEMRVSSTDCAFAQNEWAQVRIDGYVYTTYMKIPDPSELYIFISKEKFDQLQASNEAQMKDIEHYRTLANQREKNYKALLEKTGFCNLADLMTYLPKGKTLINIIDGLEDDYISERDKADALQTENEELKKKLEEFDPIPDFTELLKKLYSTDDVEKLEWTLNHVCGGRGSVNGWRAVSSFWQQNYETLSKLVGYSSVEEIQDYLTNEVQCDTLHEAMLKLIKENKYVCDGWYSANSRNNSWKAAAECNSPKELIEKLNLLRDDISGRSTVIEAYKRDIEKWQKATGCLRPEDISTESLITKAAQLEQEIKIYTKALQEWKEGTGCPSPSAAKTLIESGMSYVHGYHEVLEENRKLGDSIQKWKDMTKCETPEAAATWITSYESACRRGNRLAESVEKLKEEVVSWKNVTGYSTPEDYMHARISGAFHTPFDYTAAWQKATGCDTPGIAEERIKYYKSRLGNAIQAASCAAKHLDNITF